MTAARTDLGEATWEVKREEGRKMTLEEATEYALTKGKPATPASHAPKPPSDPWLTSLTPRQEEVAILLARDLSNRQISQELSISELTVATHVSKILRKLGLSRRSQIGSWLAEHPPQMPGAGPRVS